MSLSRPHRLWTLAESGYEVVKASTVALMISGRYMTDFHVRHWSRINPDGYCQLCMASQHASASDVNVSSNIPLGTFEHLLLECPVLNETRNKCKSLWINYTLDKPKIKDLVLINNDCNPSIQLLLDPSACADVIRSSQEFGEGILSHLFYLTRTWCHSLHVRRRKLLKLLNIL